MRIRVFLMVLLLALPMSAGAGSTSLGLVATEVALDDLLMALAKASVRLPDRTSTQRSDFSADRYANNFAALIRATGGMKVRARSQDGAALVGAVKAGKELQFAVVQRYLVAELAEEVPALARALRIVGTFGGQVLANSTVLLLDPIKIGFGQSFEFCYPGADRVEAAKYVVSMMGTFTPSEFDRILKRPGCAPAMMRYLESAP